MLGHTVQDDFPRQADATMADALAASQDPRAHPLQSPLPSFGVPYATKGSEEITPPPEHEIVIYVLAIGGAPPLAHVSQNGWVAAAAAVAPATIESKILIVK